VFLYHFAFILTTTTWISDHVNHIWAEFQNFAAVGNFPPNSFFCCFDRHADTSVYRTLRIHDPSRIADIQAWVVIIKRLDRQYRHDVVILYIDFSKAFDVVPHEIICQSVPGYVLMAFDVICYCSVRCFFTGRTHCTKIGINFSDFLQLIVGVVYGSATGPLTFVNEFNSLLDR